MNFVNIPHCPICGKKMKQLFINKKFFSCKGSPDKKHKKIIEFVPFLIKNRY